MLQSMALYGELNHWQNMAQVARTVPSRFQVAHNVIATGVDALVAEVTQSPPRPVAVTVGGTYRENRKARKLNQYWDAKFDECEVHDLGRQAVRDAISCGLGILRPYRRDPEHPEDDGIGVERIFPPHFLIDDRGAVDIQPRQAYIRRQLDKSYLAELYPDFEEEILRSRRPTNRFWFDSEEDADVAEVVEGWHLQSRKGSGDGRHVIVCGDAVLLDEPFERSRFPLAFCRAVPAQRGFWPDGLIPRAKGAQRELNKLLRRTQESMHRVGVPRVWVDRESGIVESKFTNGVGYLHYYTGNKPIFDTPQSMGRDVYNHIERLEQWVYKELGVSELSANSRKPPGLDSGAALRTYNDVQSRRFINLQRSYERMHEDVAREMVYLEKEIAEDDPSHSVGTRMRRRVKEDKWKDIELPEDRFNVRVFSASALPNTPAGKLQALEELVKMEVITPDTFLRLADVPDFESVRDLMVAPEELLLDTFDTMIDESRFIQPEPGLDLVKGRQLATLMLQRETLEGASQNDLAPLRKWIEASMQLESRIQNIEANKQMLMAQQEGMPPGMGMPPEMGMPPGMGGEMGMPPEMGIAGQGGPPIPGIEPGMPPGPPPTQSPFG
jgi:hypothetical protein